MKKRLMVLGGNAVQAEITGVARRMGYYVVSTDKFPDNPGHALADAYEPVDVIDRDAVLQSARRLHIDGIVPYCSDTLAPVAAHVATAMSLPGGKSEAVELLTHKNRFRQLLRQHGFNVPQGEAFCNADDAASYFEHLGSPAMMKPTDSSGSKGAFCITTASELRLHWQETYSYSLEGKVIIEQFIERQGQQQDGDIFILGGRLVYWGVGDQYKDPIAPFVPAAYAFPSAMPSEVQRRARHDIERVLQLAGYDDGPCNVEYVVDRNNDIYILDIGPRNGGFGIIQGLNETYSLNLNELTVKCALGELSDVHQGEVIAHGCSVVVHSQTDGVLQSYTLNERYAPYLRGDYQLVKPGSHVRRYHNGGDTIALLIFAFPSRALLNEFLADIRRNVVVSVS